MCTDSMWIKRTNVDKENPFAVPVVNEQISIFVLAGCCGKRNGTMLVCGKYTGNGHSCLSTSSLALLASASDTNITSCPGTMLAH